MIDLKSRVCVEWVVPESNFDERVLLKKRYDGVVVDTWTIGPAYYMLVMDLNGKLHTLASSEVKIVENQTHLNRRSEAKASTPPAPAPTK